MHLLILSIKGLVFLISFEQFFLQVLRFCELSHQFFMGLDEFVLEELGFGFEALVVEGVIVTE